MQARDPLPEAIPDAPVFYPTVKEFADPSRYIESISEQVRPFGIAKIVPPATWKPPFRLDKNTFGFRTRVQQINYLDGQARLRLIFVENLCRFLAKRGTPLERLPIVEFRVLDLCCLYREVVTVRGGHAAVSEQKQWSEVARALGMSPAAGGSIRQHYTRILLPYETHRKEAAERKEQEPETPAVAEGAPAASAAPADPAPEAAAPELEKEDSQDSRAGEGEAQPSAEQQKPVGRTKRMATKIEPKTEDAEAAELLASLSQAPEAGANGEGGEAMDQGADSDDEFSGFGYHDGTKYTLATYKTMADKFKADYFKKDPAKVTEKQVEEEYWKLVTTAEHDVKIEYGSELHTTIHGSGFPTSGNSLNPLDLATGSQYTRSPWNLNNLNACSLLRFVKEDIPGVISPWVYVGMLFSTFCWHYEDHFLYSINYLWDGEPKQWYGVPGDEAELFEAAMREYAPELFEQQPDLLFHLVTMISPSVLRSKGVNVCRAVQRAGEFMLTFPRAYHGGFNTGYNVAESCNFAVTDWIPWGWLGDQTYRKYNRAQVFSHPGFLFSLAEDDDTIHTAIWLLPDLQRYRQLEAALEKHLRDKGLTQSRLMDLTQTAGALSKPVVGSDGIVKGKRKIKSRYRTSAMTGMDEIRRARDEDEYVDECGVCRGSTFTALVRCSNCPNKIACLEHAEEMCGCAMEHKALEKRFDDDYVDHIIANVALRANRPAAWKDKAEELLAPLGDPPSLHPIRLFQSMATEAERFPHFLTWAPQLRNKLKEIVAHARAWAQRAHTLLTLVRPPTARAKSKDKGDAEEELATVIDLELLVADAEGMRVLQDDMAAVTDLMRRVNAWREGARAALAEGALEAERWAEMLEAGEALRVEMPEIRRVEFAHEQRKWQDRAAKLMAVRSSLDSLREILIEAEDNRFVSAEAKTLKDAVSKADVWRSKLSKARERGTTVAGLRSLLEEETSLGLEIDVEECNNVKAFVARCDDWRDRTMARLTEEKPPLAELETLMGEYKALGVYIDTHDQLKPRVTEGNAWINKARKVVPIMLAWDAERREARAQADAARANAEAVKGLVECALHKAEPDTLSRRPSVNGTVSPSPSVHSASGGGDLGRGGRNASKRSSGGGAGWGMEPPAKRPKKSEEFEHGTDRIHFFSKPLPSYDTIKEFLAEGERLRCGVDEVHVVRAAAEAHAAWLARAQAAIDDTATLLDDMFKVYHEGVLIGIDIGEVGGALLRRIWRARVEGALQAERHDPEVLGTMQEEAVQLGVEEGDELKGRLDEAAKNANPVTCFCQQLLKGTPAVQCVQCAASFHAPCLMLSQKDALQLVGFYVCAPCKRKNKVSDRATMPPGWEDYVDPSGRPIYIHRESRRTSWDPPPGAVLGGGANFLDYRANACLDRAEEGEKGQCQICFQEEEGGEDEKFQCMECGLCVHRQCYGTENATPGQPFVCKACEVGVLDPGCSLCPLTGGAIMPMTIGGWAHIVCATYLPETSFANPDRMAPIEGGSSVSKDRRRIKCALCKTNKGAVLQCDQQGCKQSWHPLCGLEAGWFMSMTEDANGDVITVCKCPKHAEPESSEEDENALYCLCQQKYVEGELMIACEECEAWYHPKCVGVSDKDADTLTGWKCCKCLGVPPPQPAAAAAPPQPPQAMVVDPPQPLPQPGQPMVIDGFDLHSQPLGTISHPAHNVHR